MALYASGVTIPTDLSGAIGGAGTNAYNKIKQNYGTAQGQFGQDATARGMNGVAAIGPGSYAGGQFATKQGLDVGNLESALGGGLGNTAYQNTLQQRDFGQQAQIAEEIARLNKPDLLSQVLGGLGSVGGTTAQIYGGFGKNKGSSPQSDPFAGVYNNV
jgi:hypothetical protein